MRHQLFKNLRSLIILLNVFYVCEINAYDFAGNPEDQHDAIEISCRSAKIYATVDMALQTLQFATSNRVDIQGMELPAIPLLRTLSYACFMGSAAFAVYRSLRVIPANPPHHHLGRSSQLLFLGVVDGLAGYYWPLGTLIKPILYQYADFVQEREGNGHDEWDGYGKFNAYHPHP